MRLASQARLVDDDFQFRHQDRASGASEEAFLGRTFDRTIVVMSADIPMLSNQ